MSELRWDPLKNNWTIMAMGQGRRPQDFWQQHDLPATGFCPFCPGYESKTPSEIYAHRPGGSARNQPGWQVRVIPNKVPALGIEGELDNRAEGLYDRMNGIGAHELIIETPDHQTQLADLSIEQITEVLKAYRVRMLDLRNDSRFRYIFIFKNCRIGTASNIQHSHSQLIAVPLIPPLVATELDCCRDHYQRKERCLVCDLIRQERQAKERIVKDDGNFLVYAPYASRFPFELMITPVAHQHDFATQTDQQLQSLAETLRDALQRIRKVLRDPPYSLILHSAPPMHSRWGRPDYWAMLPANYHWHIELAPKLTRMTGFEWGSGFHINPTAPEEAADFLRRADLIQT
ncbi:MAG: galactose-1-phosphate uridylyltransferase [Desulfuromonadales bacterium]|nr:galactose-1-phosphate uridylyltransferase [Desulfuromonadales bacterium]MBN2793497.1 galactose-1-phosphate uridylyltransferase [Desulfuromonadales bacterium]